MTASALLFLVLVVLSPRLRRPQPRRPTAASLRSSPLTRGDRFRVGRWPGEAQRVRRSCDRSLPDAVELMVVAIRAGLTPSAAVRSVADLVPVPLRPGFGGVILRLDRGHSLQSALTPIVEQVGPSAHSLVDGLANADRYGLPLGPVLDQLVVDARLARTRHSAAAARTLPVRLSFPLVMCTLPSFVLLAIVPVVLGAVSTLQGDPP